MRAPKAVLNLHIPPSPTDWSPGTMDRRVHMLLVLKFQR